MPKDSYWLKWHKPVLDSIKDRHAPKARVDRTSAIYQEELAATLEIFQQALEFIECMDGEVIDQSDQKEIIGDPEGLHFIDYCSAEAMSSRGAEMSLYVRDDLRGEKAPTILPFFYVATYTAKNIEITNFQELRKFLEEN